MVDDLGRFGSVLFSCARLLDEIAQAQVNREAGERVARPSVMRLLPHLDERGIRPTELARRIDVSKQAVGQALAELEARGFVEHAPDPADGRATLVRLTARGRAAFTHGRSVLAFYEGELRRRVGSATVTRTLAGLSAMLPVLEEWERNGAPERNAKHEGHEAARRRLRSSRR